MSGRNAPGLGLRINVEVEAAINADNYNPVSSNKIQRLTFAGNPQAITRRTYSGDVTAVGAVGDKAGLVLDTGTYMAESTPGMTTAQMAAAIAQACTLGTYDKWVVEFTGGPAAGGELCRLTINGVNYDYTAGAGDTVATIALAVATAAAADPLYNVSRIGASGKVKAEAKSRGPGYAVAGASAGAIGHTDTHSITGLAANTTWGVYVPAGSTVTAEHAVAGTTTDTLTVSTTGAAAFTCPLTLDGYPADQVIAFDGGTHSFQYTVQPGDTSVECAAGIQALINGAFGYTAVVSAPSVVDVTRTDYTTFAFADNSVTPNPASTIALTPATTQALNPPMASTAGTSLQGSRTGVGTIEFVLLAGTSFKAYLWWYDATLGTWILDGGFGTKTINGSIIYPFTTGGSRVFVQCDTFVGGATANIYVHTAG